MEFRPPGPLLAGDIDSDLVVLSIEYLNSATEHPFDLSVWEDGRTINIKRGKPDDCFAGYLSPGFWLCVDKYGVLAGPRDLSTVSVSETVKKIALTHRALVFRDECKETLGQLKKQFETLAKVRTKISPILRGISPDAYRVMLMPYSEADYDHLDDDEGHRLVASYHKYLHELGEQTIIRSSIPCRSKRVRNRASSSDSTLQTG